MGLLRSWRLPAAIVASTGCVAGATLAVSDVARTAFSNDPSGVWVANDAAGSVSHLTPGGVDATIGLDVPQGELRVVQTSGGGAYLVDESGRVSRVDAAVLEVVEEATLPSNDTQLVTGGDRLYAVDPQSGTVRELDPERLTALSSAVEVGDELGVAVADAQGVLWVPDLGTGDVVAVDGNVVVSTVPVAAPGAAIHLVVVGDVVAAIDPDGVVVIGVAGGRADPVSVPLTPGDPVNAPRNVASGDIVPMLGGSDTLALVDVLGGGVTAVDLDAEGHRLGVPEVAADKVWVPDYTAGVLLVVELPAATIGEPVVVSGEPGEFQLVVNGDHVYVNEPGSERAWAVDPRGNVIPAEKYDPDDPGTATPTPPTIPPAPDLPPPPEVDTPTAPVDTQPRPADPDTPNGDRTAAPDVTVRPPVITLAPPPVSTVRPPPPDRSDGGGTGGTGGTGDGGGATPGMTTTTTLDDGDDTTTTTVDDTTIGDTTTTASSTTSTSTTVPLPTGDGAATGVAALPGDRTITVSWTAPADWYPVTGYELALTPGGDTASVGAEISSHEFDGLTNGTAYRVTVQAVSDEATGPRVSSSTATPVAGIPDPPTGVSATAGAANATISWTASGSRVDGYRVEVTPDGGGAPVSQTVAGTERSVTIGGLTNGESYTATVTATNDGADSAPSSSGAFVPRDVPGAPGGVTASARNATEVDVSWAAAPTNGSVITEYRVTASGGATTTVGGTASAVTIGGLSTGSTYTFTVVGVNGLGPGPGATSGQVTMQSFVPSAPGNVSASAGDGSANVSWTIPPGNGTTIASFEISAGGGVLATAGGGAQSVSVGGLSNGADYSFHVVAVGANGARGPAGTAGAVTPSGAPAAPTNVTAAPNGLGTITVNWSQQSPSNGTAVASWQVTASGGGGSQTVTGPSATFSGLAHETAYTFTVVANGANGLSSGGTSASATTPQGPPTQAPNVSFSGEPYDQESVAVSWNPVPGATSYRYSGGMASGETPGTSFTTRVECGTWTFSVVAVNAAGEGPAGSVTIHVQPRDGFLCR